MKIITVTKWEKRYFINNNTEINDQKKKLFGNFICSLGIRTFRIRTEDYHGLLRSWRRARKLNERQHRMNYTAQSGLNKQRAGSMKV